MLDTTDRASIEEQYIGSCSSSNLRLENDSERRSNADILIASGMSKSHVGGALMRLHSEYSRVARDATETDYRLMMMQLKTLHVALVAVADWAEDVNIDRPRKVALAVIAHWLDHVCGTCDGQRFQRIKDSPVLSTKPCKACQGVGEIALPYGEAGRRVDKYMLSCLQSWKSATARRLFNRR